MQFDTSRAFPYPVLRPDVDDYVEGDIQVTVELSPSQDGHKVSAQVDFLVSVEELRQEVSAGRAKYMVVFACRDTYFRHSHKTTDEHSTVEFPGGSLRGEVEIYPYIVAEKEITDFTSSWINSEFGQGPFIYKVGSVMAADRPQVVYIDRDVFRSLASVFVLVKDENIGGHEWQIRPGQEKVEIVVSPEVKERIDAARNNKAHRAVLMNSIYFSAVMQCVSLVKKGDDAVDTRWGQIIVQKCHNEGINLESHEEYLITERLLKSPFQLLEAYVFQGADA